MPWRLPFATRSSTRAALLVGLVAAAAVVSVLGVALSSSWLAFGGLAVAIIGAAGFALHLIVTERRRPEVVAAALTAAATFLELLVGAMGSSAATRDPDAVLERWRREGNGVLGAT